MDQQFECLRCGKMTDSYSSPTNDSFPPVVESFGFFMFFDLCFRSITGVYIYFAYTFLHTVLLLPLSTTVLSWGYQQWKLQRSSAPIMSHFDYYTYNMAAMELIALLGAFLNIISTLIHHMEMLFWGVFIFAFSWGAQLFLPVMICLDRYQAVVFPITYVRLRQAGGLRLRNFSTALTWLLCFAGMFLIIPTMKYPHVSIFPAFATMVSVFTVSFCSLSVLYVLIRPPPGVRAVDRVQVDRSKKKAFKTIIIIMGVLLFKFVGNLTCYAVSFSVKSGDSVQCVIRASQTFLNLPSSLVLPLLFLHRKGKLPGCKHTAESS